MTLFATVLAQGDRRTPSSAVVRRDVTLRINPNTANAADLMLLPGIGPRLAEAIIAYRTRTGAARAFQTEADLNAVDRIGPKTVERLRPFLTFDAPHGEETSP